MALKNNFDHSPQHGTTNESESKDDKHLLDQLCQLSVGSPEHMNVEDFNVGPIKFRKSAEIQRKLISHQKKQILMTEDKRLESDAQQENLDCTFGELSCNTMPDPQSSPITPYRPGRLEDICMQQPSDAQ